MTKKQRLSLKSAISHIGGFLFIATIATIIYGVWDFSWVVVKAFITEIIIITLLFMLDRGNDDKIESGDYDPE